MLYRLLHAIIPPVLRLIWRPRVTGRERVPRTGGVIIASNHLSFVDSVVIPSTSPRPVRFLAKSDYFTGTGLRGAAMRLWFEGLGMLPVLVLLALIVVPPVIMALNRWIRSLRRRAAVTAPPAGPTDAT